MENSDRILGFVLKHYHEGAFDTKKASGAIIPSKRRIPFWKYASVAAAAAAVVLGIFLLRGKDAYSPLRYHASESILALDLPDGSSVTLSPGSTLSFGQGKRTREAVLDGTALFRVTHDETSPFVIQAGMSTVEVLGTTFQVRSTPKEAEVNVFEGKVKFSGSEDAVILSSGMESILREDSSSPEIISDPLPNPMAWLTGEFRYEAAPLEVVLKELSGFFGRELAVYPPEAEGKTLTGTFSSDELEPILEAISSALEVRVYER